jgi:hypothetical protein
VIELLVLTGGGHIAGIRHHDVEINVLWEAPWQTIEPQLYRESEHAQVYGAGPAGQFLAGYTGHALALGYFGMPSDAEAEQGLPLHGEPSSREWNVVSASADSKGAELRLEVALPHYQMTFQRTITLHPESLAAEIQESVSNERHSDAYIQWVEHVTFGEPFLRAGDATLSLPVCRAKTWPSGYEGRPALVDDREFDWPLAPASNGHELDLSQPFMKDRSGFVVALQLDPRRSTAYVAVLNRKHLLVAGYSFDRVRFPWVALWEENCARDYAPWHGQTRARGVEFGTSPLPLGLQQAIESGPLFGTPVVTHVPAKSRISTTYHVFVAKVAAGWDYLKDVQSSAESIVLHGPGDDTLRLKI